MVDINVLMQKTIGGLIKWYTHPIENKSQVVLMMMELKTLLMDCHAHMHVTSKVGIFTIGDLRQFLEEDIEGLNEFLTITDHYMVSDLKDPLKGFIAYLVDCSRSFVSAGAVDKEDPRLNDIMVYTAGVGDYIDYLLANEVLWKRWVGRRIGGTKLQRPGHPTE